MKQMRSDWIDYVDTEARTWIGTPYVSGAHLKGVGADCGGIIYEIFSPICGPFAPYPHYPPDWSVHGGPESYLDFILPHVRPIPAPAPGGIALFHLGLRYAHAAIVLKDGNFLHSWGRTRHGHVCIEQPRVVNYMVKRFSDGFPPKYFYPKDA
jgi:cell wall-associated NlpC family hydrolase